MAIYFEPFDISSLNFCTLVHVYKAHVHMQYLGTNDVIMYLAVSICFLTFGVLTNWH